MGDRREILLDLSAENAHADERMRDVRAWFRANGWSSPDPNASDDMYSKHPADALGPRLRELLPPKNHFAISFVAGHDLYFPGGGPLGPVCRRCGTETDFDGTVPLAADWLASRLEPSLTCPNCDWHALWGDWDISASLAVCSFAVIFGDVYLEPDIRALAADLQDQLQAELGGRWRLMHFHD